MEDSASVSVGAGTVLTAADTRDALAAGAAAVKLFPACTGGPTHLAQLRAPLPEIPLMAVGGVDLEAAGRYMAAGALAVGVGSPLLRGADRDPAPEALSALTARARALLKTVRPDTGVEEKHL